MKSIDKFRAVIDKKANKAQYQSEINDEGSFFLYREWRTACPISVLKRKGKAVLFYEGLSFEEIKTIYGDDW